MELLIGLVWGCAVCALLLALGFIWDRHEAAAKADGAGDERVPPMPAPMQRALSKTDKALLEVAALPPLPNHARKALTVRNPISAKFFEIGSKANIRAMTAETARMTAATDHVRAHTKLFNSMRELRDAEMGLAAEQELAGEQYANERERRRELMRNDQHSRAVAVQRREEELREAGRKALIAKHGIEAVEHFKDRKFALGETRADARLKDAELSKATAQSAFDDLTRNAPKSEPPSLISLVDQLLVALDQAIDEGEASGKDTAALRAERDLLQQLRAMPSMVTK